MKIISMLSFDGNFIKQPNSISRIDKGKHKFIASSCYASSEFKFDISWLDEERKETAVADKLFSF